MMRIEHLNNIDVNCEYLIIEHLEISIEDNIHNINLPIGLKKLIINNLILGNIFKLGFDETKEMLVSFIRKIKMPFGCKLYLKSILMGKGYRIGNRFGIHQTIFIYNLRNDNIIDCYFSRSMINELSLANIQFEGLINKYKNKLKSILL